LNPKTVSLTTHGHENIPDTPWDSYPRPQFRRNSYINLNGSWDFKADGSFPEAFTETVIVPFPVESKLSSVCEHFPEGTPLWYSRKLPDISHGDDELVLLHVDAVDQEAYIYVNGNAAAHIHTFEGRRGIDITPLLSDTNTITVKVVDDLGRKEYPYGKQTLSRGGMWYTPFSGIWQSVWIEVVPKEHIHSLDIISSLTEAIVRIDGPSNGAVRFEGRLIPIENSCVTLAPADPVCWTPDTPKLYEFTVLAGKDEVHSYFALRTLSVQDTGSAARLCLNGKPFFFHGLLDQGYWPDGLCTPPEPSCFAEDILAMKKLGFNTLRKHIKIEPEQFYYDCDRLGMIVFQDMVNNGSYSFIKDTIMPTIGIKKLDDRKMNRNFLPRKMFLECMENTVRMLGSHPSICCWTIFNEGWGQFEADNAYDLLKSFDSSRFIDTASGWFHPENSDVESLHVYFKRFRMPKAEKPVLLSEFGGYSCKIEGHSFNLDKTYGYRFFKDVSKYMDALEKLYLDEIIPAAGAGLSGAIYTQVSDVEDETNGLLTYDRAILKADTDRMLNIAAHLTAQKEDRNAEQDLHLPEHVHMG